MDLISPLNILNESAKLVKFMGEVIAEYGSTSIHRSRPKIFQKEFSVVVLPPGARSALSDFTGPQEGITLVVTLNTTKETSDQSELDATSASLQEDEVHQGSQPAAFPLVIEKIIKTGQPLPQKRVHLTKSTTLHSGSTADGVECTHVADLSSLAPLTLDQARYIASLYSLSCRSVKPLPNLWIVCESEKNNVVALGCSFDATQSLLYTYTITSEGTLHFTQPDEPLIAAKDASTVKPVSGSVYSQYRIAGAAADTDDKMAGNLTVQFCWKDPEKLLCPPPETSNAVVRVSVTPGYMFSPVLATYNELNTLLKFCQISCGQAVWPTQNEASETTENISQMTGSFLEDVASPLSQPLDATVISPTADSTVYESRKNLDFTERLWMFAKDAASLDDLQEIFATVFKALLLGKVQLFVHRNSNSALSQLLRQLLRCTSIEDCQALAPRFQSLLSQTKILPCLIQIGLEKLKQDYRTFFVGSDIVTDDQLDQFYSTTVSHSLLVQCHTLCKLHCVLEINASVLSFLNLPASTLSSLTKTALDVFKSMEFKKFGLTPIVALPLPAYTPSLKSVASLCASLHPLIWSYSPSKEQSLTVYRSEALFGEQDNVASDLCYVYKAQFDCVCMQ